MNGAPAAHLPVGGASPQLGFGASQGMAQIPLFHPHMVPPPMPPDTSRAPGIVDVNHQDPAPAGGPQPSPAPFPPFMFPPPIPGMQSGQLPPPDLMAAWMSNPAAFQAVMALNGMPPPPPHPGMPPMGPSAMPPAPHINFPPPAPTPRGATFVNAKQYNRILKRREARAKMEELFEAKRAADAAKKPYIHESRHRHAMKRPRGKGGRFLTKDELKEFYKKHPDRDPKNMNSDSGSESPNSSTQTLSPPAKKHKPAYQNIAASIIP